MKKTLAYIIALPFLAFIIFLVIGMFFTDKYVADAFERVSSGSEVRNFPESRFSCSESDTLPQPLRRFFRNAIDSGAVKPVFVRMKQTGEFKTDESQPFRKFTAAEYFSVPNTSFMWDADIHLFSFIRLHAVDLFAGGRGSMLIKLLSGITVTDAKGMPFDNSGLFRFFSEAVCFPTALLPSEIVSWKVIDDTSAELTVLYKGLRISAVFYFNEKGEVVKITTHDKYRTARGGFQKENFTMYCGSYKKYERFNVPTYFETEWNLQDRNFTYAKVNITEIEYNVVEMYK